MPKSVDIVESSWGRTMVFKPGMSEQLVQEIVPGPLELSLVKIEEENDDRRFPSADKIFERINTIDLPYLLASIFGTILEDTLTQLRILEECNTELRIIKTRSDWNQLQCTKYDIEQPTCMDELYGINLKNLGCDEHKITKLGMDRTFVTNVMKATYVDLCLNKTFKPLEDSINAFADRERYRAALEQDEANNRIVRHELIRQLRQQRNHIKSVIYDTDVKIDELKTLVEVLIDAYIHMESETAAMKGPTWYTHTGQASVQVRAAEDSVLISECQGRYIDNWQGARTEQHTQSIHDKEAVFSNSLEYFKQRTDHEQRVHLEVEMLTNIAINETLQKIEDMMTKYDTDMEEIDLKIQIKKNDYQNMKDKRIGLEEMIEKHDKLIKEWTQFKEEREKARLYHEKMTNSAVTVQAWWRGLLVRRQLGPYKVVKKKGAPKKK